MAMHRTNTEQPGSEPAIKPATSQMHCEQRRADSDSQLSPVSLCEEGYDGLAMQLVWESNRTYGLHSSSKYISCQKAVNHFNLVVR